MPRRTPRQKLKHRRRRFAKLHRRPVTGRRISPE